MYAKCNTQIIHYRVPKSSSHDREIKQAPIFQLRRPVAILNAQMGPKRRRRPIRIHHFLIAPSHARDLGEPVPQVDTVAELAKLLGMTIGQLEWCADTSIRAGIDLEETTRVLRAIWESEQNSK
jgi:hypothetical protein